MFYNEFNEKEMKLSNNNNKLEQQYIVTDTVMIFKCSQNSNQTGGFHIRMENNKVIQYFE